MTNSCETAWPLIMRTPIVEYLQNEVVIMDGGQGTELERRGINVSHPLWSSLPFITKDAKQLEHIKEMYKDFIDAGSNALMTITYQASYDSLCKFSNGSVTTREQYDLFLEDIIRFTVQECITPDQYLLGSIGPYAAFLCNGAEYSGDYGLNEIDFIRYFEPQVQNFSQNPLIDMIAIETIPNIKELKCLLSSKFGEMVGSKPFYVSISTTEEGNLRDGTTWEDLCEEIHNLSDQVSSNLLFLGINCVNYHHCYATIERLNKRLDTLGCDSHLRFKVVYPNSGEIYDGETHSWSPNPHIAPNETWGFLVSKLLEQDCKVIGGCCRTTPKDIREIKKALEFSKNHRRNT